MCSFAHEEFCLNSADSLLNFSFDIQRRLWAHWIENLRGFPNHSQEMQLSYPGLWRQKRRQPQILSELKRTKCYK